MVPSYFSGKFGQNLVGPLTCLKSVVKAQQPAPYGPVLLSEVVPPPVGTPDVAFSLVTWSRLSRALSRAERASSLALTLLR